MEGDPLIQFFIPSMRVWILGEKSRDQSLPADVVPLRSFFFILFLFVSEKLPVSWIPRSIYTAFIFEALMTFDLRYLSFRKGRINNKRTLVLQGNVNRVRDCMLKRIG